MGLAGRIGTTLAAQVRDQLHQLDLVAAGARRHSEADVARIRAELHTLVTAWRRLLELHRPLSNGYCPWCRRWDGWRRRRWPCPVWTDAHTHLVSENPLPPGSR